MFLNIELQSRCLIDVAIQRTLNVSVKRFFATLNLHFSTFATFIAELQCCNFMFLIWF